jgi:hypothetical protein
VAQYDGGDEADQPSRTKTWTRSVVAGRHSASLCDRGVAACRSRSEQAAYRPTARIRRCSSAFQA